MQINYRQYKRWIWVTLVHAHRWGLATGTFVLRYLWALLQSFASVLGEIFFPLIIVCGIWFPFATAGFLDLQLMWVKPLGSVIYSYVPFWYGGCVGYVLLILASIHDGIIAGLASLHSLSRWTIWMLTWFLPKEWAKLPHMINDLTFAWARIIFGAVLVYFECRVGWIVWFFLGKPFVWIYREDRKDHLSGSHHPMYRDRPVWVRHEPPPLQPAQVPQQPRLPSSVQTGRSGMVVGGPNLPLPERFR